MKRPKMLVLEFYIYADMDMSDSWSVDEYGGMDGIGEVCCGYWLAVAVGSREALEAKAAQIVAQKIEREQRKEIAFQERKELEKSSKQVDAPQEKEVIPEPSCPPLYSSEDDCFIPDEEEEGEGEEEEEYEEYEEEEEEEEKSSKDWCRRMGRMYRIRPLQHLV